MSAQAAQAGPILKSLPKKVMVRSRPSSQVSWAQIVDRKASPASTKHNAPTKRRPHLRLPERRINQSDTAPPRIQAKAPAARGREDSQARCESGSWRYS